MTGIIELDADIMRELFSHEQAEREKQFERNEKMKQKVVTQRVANRLKRKSFICEFERIQEMIITSRNSMK